MSDFEKAIAPKSDQLNADDLIGGKTMDITITKVDVNLKSDQKVTIHYEGEDGRPFKPCKTVSRVLKSCWGDPEKHSYEGRTMRLYCDPKVKWAGQAVGGIRVSHLSHIEKDTVVGVTESKGRRTAYKVKALIDKIVDKMDETQRQQQQIKETATFCVQSINAAQDENGLTEVMDKIKNEIETVKSFSDPAYNHIMTKHKEKLSSLSVDSLDDTDEVIPV